MIKCILIIVTDRLVYWAQNHFTAKSESYKRTRDLCGFKRMPLLIVSALNEFAVTVAIAVAVAVIVIYSWKPAQMFQNWSYFRLRKLLDAKMSLWQKETHTIWMEICQLSHLLRYYFHLINMTVEWSEHKDKNKMCITWKRQCTQSIKMRYCCVWNGNVKEFIQQKMRKERALYFFVVVVVLVISTFPFYLFKFQRNIQRWY